MLRFALLGPFEAWRDSARIPHSAWRTQKTLTALKILIDTRGRPIRTERIADLVWPDADAAGACNSLQVAIRSLRTTLEPGLARGARYGEPPWNARGDYPARRLRHGDRAANGPSGLPCLTAGQRSG